MNLGFFRHFIGGWRWWKRSGIVIWVSGNVHRYVVKKCCRWFTIKGQFKLD